MSHAGAVASVGDINGDGIGDFLVGAGWSSPLGRYQAGAAYLIFGSKKRRDLYLANLGSRGFEIAGMQIRDQLGEVAGAGDFNGDGSDDLMLGAADGTRLGRRFSGVAFIVYGRRGMRSR
jgi:hypothetical protein